MDYSSGRLWEEAAFDEHSHLFAAGKLCRLVRDRVAGNECDRRKAGLAQMLSPPQRPHDVLLVGRARHLSRQMHQRSIDLSRRQDINPEKILDLLDGEPPLDGVEYLFDRNDATFPHMRAKIGRQTSPEQKLEGSPVRIIEPNTHFFLFGDKLLDRLR